MNEYRIEEIRDRLKSSLVNQPGMLHMIDGVVKDQSILTVGNFRLLVFSKALSLETKLFFLGAPDDMKFLLEEIDRLEIELSKANSRIFSLIHD